jgi:hypothetical protein
MSVLIDSSLSWAQAVMRSLMLHVKDYIDLSGFNRAFKQAYAVRSKELRNASVSAVDTDTTSQSLRVP